MLTRYRGGHNRLRFCTYDLEWVPETLAVRIVGVYDEEKGYRSYESVTDFLRAELIRENRDKVFFAHAGGLADVQFVLDAILARANPHLRVKCHFSGSSAIIVTVALGKRNVFRFCDSFWLLKDSLAKIGKSLGLEKGGAEYRCSEYPACGHQDKGKSTCIFYAPLGILSDYNALDCRILYIAVRRLEDEIMALGGSLKSTIASTALLLFRASYLTHDIKTSEAINKLARDSYVASRVEVIQRESPASEYYDINSSFPFSMTKPQPGTLLGHCKYREGSRLMLVKARVTVPDTIYIPPLPARIEDRVYFPVGTFERWFMGEDLLILLESGGRIESISECYYFEAFNDLAYYTESIYALRRQSKDDFQRLVYKYLMNALYGKFGEGDDKVALLINPKGRPQCSQGEKCARVCRCLHMYSPGVWKVEKKVSIPHAHVPIASAITASSRALITYALQHAARSGGVYYCDTDSIVTTERLPTSDALGSLKHEKSIERGTFLAAKLYRLYPGPEIKAKGFPRLTNDDFERLSRGEPITIDRMIRIRENMASGSSQPAQKTLDKRAIGHLSKEELSDLGLPTRFSLITKRCFNKSDGDSRPWDYSELKEKHGM